MMQTFTYDIIAGAQDVELAFSGMTGTVTGEVFVEFFVLQAP